MLEFMAQKSVVLKNHITGYTAQNVKVYLDMLQNNKLTSDNDRLIKEMLEFRQDSSLTSLKKLDTLLEMSQFDGRIHDVFNYYGAPATGRFSSTGMNFQNLPRGGKDPKEMLEKLKAKTISNKEMQSLIRPCFKADPGKLFCVSDFSQIEARVLAWFAGEQWVLDSFKNKLDLYKVTASKLYHKEYDDITKEERQIGKTCMLALGYQSGEAGLMAFDQAGQITDSERPILIQQWRQANSNIVNLWNDMDRAVKLSIMNVEQDYTVARDRVWIQTKWSTGEDKHKNLYISLPSGRKIVKHNIRIEQGEIRFDNYNKGDFESKLYGGSLTNLITQGTARDILCSAMLRIDNINNVTILGHVHDEVFMQIDEEATADLVHKAMTIQPSFCHDLPLAAETTIGRYYDK
jgi:DNA polymerase